MSAFPILCALASISLAVGGVSAQPDESCIDSNVEYKTGRRGLAWSGVAGGPQWQAHQRATQDSSGWLYRSNRVVWFVDRGQKWISPAKAIGGARSNSRAPFGTILSRECCDWKRRKSRESAAEKDSKAKPHCSRSLKFHSCNLFNGLVSSACRIHERAKNRARRRVSVHRPLRMPLHCEHEVARCGSF